MKINRRNPIIPAYSEVDRPSLYMVYIQLSHQGTVLSLITNSINFLNEPRYERRVPGRCPLPNTLPRPGVDAHVSHFSRSRFISKRLY